MILVKENSDENQHATRATFKVTRPRVTVPERRRPGRTRRPDTESSSVRTLERGLSLLSALASEPGASLSELARRTGLSVSTTYRLLETLRQQRFVEHDPERGRWFVGLGSFQVGASYVGGSDLLGAARAEAERLVADLNETVNVAVLGGGDVVYVQQVEGQHMVRMFTRLGARAPLHCTGVGKVLIAWRPEDEVRRLMGEEPYPAFTPQTLTSLVALLAELQEVRARGYALDEQEREAGVRCVAAPIWDAGGRVTAALSLSAPTLRLGDERIQHCAARLCRAAATVSERLGARLPAAPLEVSL